MPRISTDIWECLKSIQTKVTMQKAANRMSQIKQIQKPIRSFQRASI